MLGRKLVIDYSLYLVTGRELLPPGKDYYESLEESLKDGHVTVVQLREKNIDSGEFLEIAEKSLKICDKYRVPMLINDNLSVALALPERVGLHIGQTDIPVQQARKILGPNRHLGLSVHNVEQAEAAVDLDIVDYVGVGPVYGTKSKAGIEEKDVLGPRGASRILQALEKVPKRLPCVLIGGLNEKTAAGTLFGAVCDSNWPDGIAVISAIVAHPTPSVPAANLAKIVKSFKKAFDSHAKEFGAGEPPFTSYDIEKNTINKIAELLRFHRASQYGPPLIQTLTSHVSSTLSANIALAFSSSPIMSHQEAEAEDLGKVTGAVVLNIGTIGDEARRGMRAVGGAANRGGKPVVLDPVGVGASSFRKGVVEEIMNHTQITLLKGNAAELSAISGLEDIQSRGVDSGSGTLKDPVNLVVSMACKEKCLVLLTGKEDYLSNGQHAVKVSNGHELLGRITGSGCALGVVVAASMAAACNFTKHNKLPTTHLGSFMVHSDTNWLFIGALMGVLSMNIASELAAERSDVKGSGTFIPALIDELAAMTPEKIVERAKFGFV
ncbi:hydroxyethylthiazole kinase [Meira miltonrushii]|uniref:Hydroxyethylthiazole kinase n=1 Tax=Meira miltonrushii TaxID=1280837 RepID=A0A316VDE9_9BASI|nr:hydroxyethylthiazole kinase [Meira miltonrushii]PWN35118.1 hydroxyethylthiazole kinase [Meira miltonrushii]